MKRTMLSFAAALGTTLAASSLVATPAAASSSIVQDWLQLTRDPHQFYLFDQSSEKRLSYRQPRDFRVCAKTKDIQMPLEVRHDDTRSVVEPGACISFQAKNVVIRTAKQPDDNWNLVGNVKKQTRANS